MRLVRFIGLLILILALGIGAVSAAPNTQDDTYEISVVGGDPYTATLPAFSQDGIVIGETTAVSEYPAGMRFTTTITSDTDAVIESATLFIDYRVEGRTRVDATFNRDGQWEAFWIPANGSFGMPWQTLNVYWSVGDSSGQTTLSEPTPVFYADVTREWTRIESSTIEVLYFGYADRTPDDIAVQFIDRAQRYRATLAEVFPAEMLVDAVPQILLFPEDAALIEIIQGDIGPEFLQNPQQAQAGINGDAYELFSLLPECPYGFDLDADADARYEMIFSYHLPQVLNTVWLDDQATGLPGWWAQGQIWWLIVQAFPEEFANSAMAELLNPQRILNLAQIDPDAVAPLAVSEIPLTTAVADGCYNLGHAVGRSFIDYLVAIFDGVEIHQQIVNGYKYEGLTLIESIEAATGESFIDLENSWRAATGFTLITLADIDPIAALPPAVEAPYQPDDTATIPGPRPVTLQTAPASGLGNPCFPGTVVTVLRGVVVDGVVWYEIDCVQTGWVSETDLP